MKKIILLLILPILLILPGAAKAHHDHEIEVRDSGNNILFKLPVENTSGGLSLEAADLGTDGIPEIIVAPGVGTQPRIRVLREDGSEIGSFLAYASTLGVGLNVETCDLTGDKVNEIITAPQRGGGPHVRIFSNMGEPIGPGFFAYAQTFRGGVNLACADITGDNKAELLTLPSAGGGPHLRVWNLVNENVEHQKDLFVFDDSDRSGLIAEVKNKKIYVAQQKHSTSTIKTILFDESFNETIQTLETVSIDKNGLNNLFFHGNDLHISTATENAIYNTATKEKIETITNNGGVHATTINDEKIIYTSSKPIFIDSSEEKKIIVDIETQTFFAYEKGILQNTFLISSGKNDSTPLGDTKILAKLQNHRYAWFYGENDPRNFDIGDVPYNLRIFPHIYFHYAWWHNNWGHKMSHGCINVALDNVMWLYDWAEEGTLVTTR